MAACVDNDAGDIGVANSAGRVNWAMPVVRPALQLAVNNGFNLHVNRVVVATVRLIRLD